MKVIIEYNGTSVEMEAADINSAEDIANTVKHLAIREKLELDEPKPENQAAKFEGHYKNGSANIKFDLEERITRMTYPAFDALMELDDGFVGSYHYMGIAYFWSYEYRHYLRDTTYAKRVMVHTALLDAGLAVDGTSDKHEEIIERIVYKK